jgi:glycosyltransferase involved in cell wall biosynthesis
VLGRGGAVRTLGWIPDLQHRDLPEFFGEAECRVRDGAFRMLCSDCDAVVVSSEHAREGLLEFVPSAASKLHVLRFVPQVPSVESLPTRRELAERYGVDGPYFHLPNQFWKHKNHTIVLDALAQLRRDGAPAVVVATGSKEDYRNPGHFDALMRRVRTEGLEADFRVLGVVPYADMLGLMCSAVAVINPSFFEGWSTTVEEAKRMGARVILSDIAVHREQAPNRGIFFAPRSADALATAMLETLRSRSELDRAGAEGAYVAFGEAYQRLVLGILGVRDGT